MENHFFLKGKTTGQTPNNFTILNRDYNTQRYNLSKKKTIFFFSLTALFLTVYFLLLSLFFSCACSHSHSSSRLHLVLTLWDFTSFSPLGLHIFTPQDFTSSAHLHQPNGLSIHLFLLFSLSHSSYQVTINASQLILTLLQPISFLQLSLISRMTLAFCFFLFFLPSNVSHKFNITYSFMWLDFCTSLHKCCSTFVHNYRGKDEPNFFSFGQASPASSICFAGFLPIFQQAHLMS